MTINLIYCRSINGVIGNNNSMPWTLKEDMQRFRSLTEGNTVVMGRKTYESIGKPLRKRQSVVLTRNKDLYIPVGDFYNNTTVGSIEDALRVAGKDTIYIIGGLEIYKMFFDKCDNFFETIIMKHFDGDTKYTIDYNNLKIWSTQTHYSSKEGFYYQFNHWIRRK